MPIVLAGLFLVVLALGAVMRGFRNWRADRTFQRSIQVYDESRRARIRRGEDPRSIPTAEDNLVSLGYGSLVSRIKRVPWVDPLPPASRAAPPPALPRPPTPDVTPVPPDPPSPVSDATAAAVVPRLPMPDVAAATLDPLPPASFDAPPAVLPLPSPAEPKPAAPPRGASRPPSRASGSGASLQYDITYASQWGDVTERRIRVQHVYSEHGEIYIDAHCYLRGEQRQFRADRMLSVTERDTGHGVVDPVTHFSGFIDPDEIVTPEHELVMGKARPGLLGLIWIGRADGDLDDETTAVLMGYCADRARLGRGAAAFNPRQAERWILDSRPTFETASGGLARVKRGGPEWQMIHDRARDIAALGAVEKRGKRLVRLFRV